MSGFNLHTPAPVYNHQLEVIPATLLHTKPQSSEKIKEESEI